MKKSIIMASLVLVSCGVEEESEEPIVVVQPRPNVVYVPVSVYVPVPCTAATPAPAPAAKVNVCQVLLTDSKGNISRLTKYDTFTRDMYLAAEFTPEHASEYVRLKTNKIAGTVTKLCYTKEQAK